MGFLSGLFHSRDKPINSTNGSAYRFLFGGSNSGKAINERSAMQMTAVYACVRILSESIAGLPVHIYKYTNSGSKKKAIKPLLYRLIHDEPNPEMTSFVFRETLMTHLLLYGNAYAQIIRNGKGEVIALYPLMANRMSVDSDDKGHLYEIGRISVRPHRKRDSIMGNVMLIPARRQIGNNARKQEEEKPKLRVAAYCRVSTDSDEQATSYEAQVEHYTEYIQKNSDLEFAGIYADDGISGTNTKKREEFNHMIDDCKAGNIDMIITKFISRFASNTLDCLKYIRQLKDMNIPVLFEK